jgi:hypothetical protein
MIEKFPHILTQLRHRKVLPRAFAWLDLIVADDVLEFDVMGSG